ncbi:UNVERIFIED_CONTAM: hypothetical protein RMT77_018816 [Armadillidium vulgare]
MKENQTLESLEALKSEMEHKNMELETEVKNMKQKLEEIETKKKSESPNSDEKNDHLKEEEHNGIEERVPNFEKESNIDRILKEALDIYVNDLSPQIQKENFQEILNSENKSNEEENLKEALNLYQKDLPTQILKDDFQELKEHSIPLQEKTLEATLILEKDQEDKNKKENLNNVEQSETNINKSNFNIASSSDVQNTIEKDKNTEDSELHKLEIKNEKFESSDKKLPPINLSDNKKFPLQNNLAKQTSINLSDNEKFPLQNNLAKQTSNSDDQNTKPKDENTKDFELHTLEIKNDKSESIDEEFPCIKFSDNKKFPLALVSAINMYRNKRGACSLLLNDEMSQKCLIWATVLSKTDLLVQDNDCPFETILCVEKLHSENTKVLPQKIVDGWFNNQKVKKVRKFTDPRDEPKSKRIGNLACPFTKEISECGASIVYTDMKKAYIVAYFN